ncbi:EI24 domain-containing protein [Microbacterium sp. Au-Mic1]|uniref:EI24 domain-containing protein n=1 Tax=Microbacterium sp. Au-Mic1 TaxID=2906457 RepID=UPI001E4E9CD3|nr:EI24 domain-containing protein [Microbacterium sp. Au-Mic1]MCE4025371.1 EI24 domain-containing protein [Microbacterium sp. Au-Mic1]
MIREFAAGFGTLVRGFGLWRTHPRLLALGLIPALISVAVLAAALVPFGLSLGSLTAWMTPFADGWLTGWRDALRIAIGIVLFVAATVLSGLVFTALTLTIGDPFYQRIWRGVESSLGGEEPTGETGFWSTVGEGLRLIGLGVLVALFTLLLGFIPLVGGPLATVVGVLLSGRLLARELTGRAFDARGLGHDDRLRLLGSGRARVLGFGVATQLCFMIPLGAVITMPAAVAGSTMLARALTERAANGMNGRGPGDEARPVGKVRPTDEARPVEPTGEASAHA